MKNKSGHMLVSLLIFIVVALVVLVSSIGVVISNSRASLISSRGNQVYAAAEAGIENAILKILRDPSYTGEVFVVDGSAVTITVDGTSPRVITSTAVDGTYVRRIRAEVSRSGGILSVSNWREE